MLTLSITIHIVIQRHTSGIEDDNVYLPSSQWQALHVVMVLY